MENVLIAMIAGLVSGISTWFILEIMTLRLRAELKTEAKAELERIRSQEGYNNTSFLRGRRKMPGEDVEKRELMSTAFGAELKEINDCVWKASLVVASVVVIIVIVLRFIED